MYRTMHPSLFDTFTPSWDAVSEGYVLALQRYPPGFIELDDWLTMWVIPISLQFLIVLV